MPEAIGPTLAAELRARLERSGYTRYALLDRGSYDALANPDEPALFDALTGIAMQVTGRSLVFAEARVVRLRAGDYLLTHHDRLHADAVHSRRTPPRGQRFACYTAVVSEKQIDEVAKELAEAHLKEDPSTTAVFLAEDRAEVRLVEVSGSIVTSGEVLPFRFAARPDRGVPYPSVVVLLSEDDWARIERGELELPPGWGTPVTLKKIA